MLMWIDVETTGLDPRDGHLLELAMVLTDDELNVVEQREWLVKPNCIDNSWIGKLDPRVFEMHSHSRLLVPLHGGAGCSLDRVLAEASGWLGQLEVQHKLGKVPLAGSTVSFDRAWLKEHLPALESRFSYRNVDVSSIKELCYRWRPELMEERDRAKKPAAHRAMPDVLASIEELKFYRERGFLTGGGVR